MRRRFQNDGRGWRLLRGTIFVFLVALMSFLSLRAETSRAVPPAPFIVTEVNPNVSTVTQPANADAGGRVNGLAVRPDDSDIVYAASEWGGIYRTTDGGAGWDRLAGHRPNATWDVAVDPRPSCADGVDNGDDGNIDLLDDDCVSSEASEDGGVSRIVYATSFYDGRVSSDAGINVSYDGGGTWTHPTVPAPTFGGDLDTCDGVARIGNDTAGWTEPSAFGISVRQDNGRKAFIGTKCGIAVSLDSGVNWTHVDPNPATPGGRVWDVVVHASGMVDICGDDGHFRSLDDGVTWVDRDAASLNFLPVTSSVDTCSIAASPLEPDTLYAVVASTVFETRNGGVNWNQVDTIGGGRVPFVVANLTDANPESGVQCNNSGDSDGDTIINDGCPAVGTSKEDSLQCGNDLDDDGDNEEDDGCGGLGDPPAFGGFAPEVTNTCANATDDDDLDGKINDGCPAVGPAEAGADCDDADDDDTDGFVNDGCFFPAGSNNTNVFSGDNSEGTDTNQCDDAEDDDADGATFAGRVNDGCPRRNFDIYIGDGVRTFRLPCGHSDGVTIGCAETGADCTDAVDDDGDGVVNDGCPALGTAETPAQCADAVDANEDGPADAVNDGCGLLLTSTRIDFGAHADPGDLEFNLAPGTVPACPLYFSNDGGVYKSLGCQNGPEAACGEAVGAAVDDDADGKVNDGCPPNGPAEVECDAPQGDEDGDGAVNDGCIWTRSMQGIHGQWLWAMDGASQCDGNADDDGDTKVNDGCRQIGLASESGADCDDAVDDDAADDGGAAAINDGCPQVGPASETISIYHGDQDTGVWFSRDGGATWATRRAATRSTSCQIRHRSSTRSAASPASIRSRGYRPRISVVRRAATQCQRHRWPFLSRAGSSPSNSRTESIRLELIVT